MKPEVTTTSWTGDELTAIGRAEELQLASRRADGTLRPYVTMWVVRAADQLYVRSARGALDTGKRGGPEPEAITLENFGRDIPEA